VGKVWDVYIVPAVESLTHLGCEVPVITIFTKFDGLVTSAYTELLDSVDEEKAEGQMVRLAQDKLEEDFKKPLMTTKSPPSDYVHLKGMPAHTYFTIPTMIIGASCCNNSDMHKGDSNCAEIIEKTADALTNDTSGFYSSPYSKSILTDPLNLL
jgi:hypothetical protein